MTALEAVLLALACWRWTRLVCADSLTAHWRERVTTWARGHDELVLVEMGERMPWRTKVAVLTGCPHCLSPYAALWLVAVWQWAPSWGLAWVVLVVVPAVAAVTSLFALILPPE